MTSLARKLRTVDYFTLAFGTMVGVGWLAACASFLGIEKTWRRRSRAFPGIAVCATLILMKFLFSIPGHFTLYEYVALAVWIAIGLAARRRGQQV
jgi:hypothetical protein